MSGLSSILLGSLWVRSCLGSLIFKLRHLARVVSQNSSNLASHRRACIALSRSATLSQPVTISKSSDCNLSQKCEMIAIVLVFLAVEILLNVLLPQILFNDVMTSCLLGYICFKVQNH